MAGLINTKIESPMLKQAEDNIEKNLSADQREIYFKILTSGMGIAMGGGVKSLAASLKKSKDPLVSVVKGALGLLAYMRAQAKGVMPTRPMVQAGMTLVLQGLDFAERLGLLKADKKVLAKAAQMYASAILEKAKVTPQRLQQMIRGVHGIVSDPAKLARLKQAHAKDEQMKQARAQRQAQPPQPAVAPQAPPPTPPRSGLINAGRPAMGA